MNRWRSQCARLIKLMCVALLVATMMVGTLAPVIASDVCLVYDDHGNCLLWQSQSDNTLHQSFGPPRN